MASDRARLLWRRVPEAEKERNVELRVRSELGKASDVLLF
jgi:hypothetical protein